jgi:hypothetical protein
MVTEIGREPTSLVLYILWRNAEKSWIPSLHCRDWSDIDRKTDRPDLMEVDMKAFLLTLATLALAGHTALAADAATPSAGAVYASTACAPGMTAATPNSCSLPGFHWEYTTAYVGDHGDARSVWMLLPDK